MDPDHPLLTPSPNSRMDVPAPSRYLFVQMRRHTSIAFSPTKTTSPGPRDGPIPVAKTHARSNMGTTHYAALGYQVTNEMDWKSTVGMMNVLLHT
ncbi:hypothetical protein ASPCADRAFT_205018 [Aspergillus carbonarius ITEM 5010]|uniref:Uncharacterized protein n=1 Tax=Aspergillus carbonarius (strain ITEM 5010) TaxID=602072 RepID=A0A1R3RTH8_ASPC5|nr:hypothetical protein ASPCADRAFT_205018 [Aspergillus carbonarius ITEM 5010]